VRTQVEYTYADMSADVKNLLIPAIQDAIAHLVPPLTTRADVIAAFTTPSGDTWHIRAEDVLAYKAALEAAVGLLDTAVAYSWDDGGFDWNLSYGEMDADLNGFLEPSEYLPGGSFGTLLYPALLANGWTSLNAALADALVVANKMATTPADPLQFLARIEDGQIQWLAVYAGIQTAQRALSGPTVVQYDYWDPVYMEDLQADITTNLREFWSATNPIDDLKELAPTFEIIGDADTCLEVYSVPDMTMHGIFPNGETEIPDAAWDEWFGNCGGGPDLVYTVHVSPSEAWVDQGEGQLFSAWVEDQYGVQHWDVSVNWYVMNPTAGTMVQDGLFTAGVTPGDYWSTVAAQIWRQGSFIGTAYATVHVGETSPPPPPP